jgi:hypothetical protein
MINNVTYLVKQGHLKKPVYLQFVLGIMGSMPASIENIPDFWACVWDFAEIKASKGYDTVVDDVRKMPGAKWFIGARMNFAENLLRYRDDHTAFIFKGETEVSARTSYRELYDTVARLAKSLRDMGVAPGDRVAAYMPNMIETAVAMLAATSIGAVWSSCATDIGPEAAKDRFGQIEPKVLFTVDGYYYKGKSFATLPNAAEVATAIPSLEKVVAASYTGEKADISHVPNAVHYGDFLSKESGLEIQFEQLPSDLFRAAPISTVPLLLGIPSVRCMLVKCKVGVWARNARRMMKKATQLLINRESWFAKLPYLPCLFISGTIQMVESIKRLTLMSTPMCGVMATTFRFIAIPAGLLSSAVLTPH